MKFKFETFDDFYKKREGYSETFERRTGLYDDLKAAFEAGRATAQDAESSDLPDICESTVDPAETPAKERVEVENEPVENPPKKRRGRPPKNRDRETAGA